MTKQVPVTKNLNVRLFVWPRRLGVDAQWATYGIAAGPIFLLLKDWMFHVIGAHEEKAFVGNKAYAVIETIVNHDNLIAHQLTAPGRYTPMMRKSYPATGPMGFAAP